MEKQNLILLPSHHQCLELMEAHGMLPNIREHSFRVMEVARFLGEALAEAGFDLHLPLVTVGALLHDLGKTQCLGTLMNHAELGAGFLESLGYPHVAQVVREHVHLDGNIMDPRPLREAEVVNYADKRVLHEEVVTLAARFADLKVRYGRTPEALARIQATEVRARTLEDRLFASLHLTPLDLLRVNGKRGKGGQCAPYDKLFRTALE
jgi:putative nucleotidyltransferase with HDIG domain